MLQGFIPFLLKIQALDIFVLRMHGSSNYNKVTWDSHVTRDDKFWCHLRFGSFSSSRTHVWSHWIVCGGAPLSFFQCHRQPRGLEIGAADGRSPSRGCDTQRTSAMKWGHNLIFLNWQALSGSLNSSPAQHACDWNGRWGLSVTVDSIRRSHFLCRTQIKPKLIASSSKPWQLH